MVRIDCSSSGRPVERHGHLAQADRMDVDAGERALQDRRVGHARETSGIVARATSAPPVGAQACDPVRRAPHRAALGEAEVDVVAVRRRRVDVLADLAVLAQARPVGDEVLHAGGPVGAVPDHLLDAHPARERVLRAGGVGRQEELDEPPRLVAIGGVADVQVPVDRAVLGVQRRLVRSPLLAAVGTPEHTVGMALQPADERRHARLGLGRAVRGGVVDLGIGRDVDEVIGRVVGQRPERVPDPERAGRGSHDERRDHGGKEDERAAHAA